MALLIATVWTVLALLPTPEEQLLAVQMRRLEFPVVLSIDGSHRFEVANELVGLAAAVLRRESISTWGTVNTNTQTLLLHDPIRDGPLARRTLWRYPRLRDYIVH